MLKSLFDACRTEISKCEFDGHFYSSVIRHISAFFYKILNLNIIFRSSDCLFKQNSNNEQELSGLLKMLSALVKHRINIVLIFSQQTITPTFHTTFFITRTPKFPAAPYYWKILSVKQMLNLALHRMFRLCVNT